ncbi:MAG: thiolase family protein [Candidatus Aureabacteria bacterium]|nr:thiolase family protein [Candidatus Auribacterota bacterium]
MRTPLGSFYGSLRQIPATRLAGIVIKELLGRSRVAPGDVDETILGNVLSAGLGQNRARQAAAFAGIPFSSSALTVDMVCGSGLRAVCLAAQAIHAGDSRVIVAGGAENMSAAPHLIAKHRIPNKPLSSMRYDGLRCAFRDEPMGVFAESLARAAGVGREEQDRYSFESHRRASAAVDAGFFDTETVAIPPGREGSAAAFSRDECPRRDCTPEKLARLKPAFDPRGTVTAGNSTPIADGAAALIVASEGYVREKGIVPLARILSWCTIGVTPEETFGALAPAIRRLLDRSGVSLDAVDLFEIGDSFAVEGIVCVRELGLSPDRVNRRGGTLALGHPLGASGARILVTLLHTLAAERKRLGVAVICLGGGNAVAMLVETTG